MLKFLLITGLILLAKSFGEAQDTRTLCSQTSSMVFNATQLSGVWWEVARNPTPASLACVRVNFTEIQPDNVMEIATTYSVSTTYLWVNQTMFANVSLANDISDGFNISYVNGISRTEYTVYKLLNTDYKSFALFCGCTNATNNETSFGIILTRERFPNTTQLMDIEHNAATQYADFSFGTMPLVTQSPTCYAAGAATQYSMCATLFALLHAVLNCVT